MNMTGSLQAIEASSKPLACAGERGMTTRRPGVLVSKASGD